MSSPTHPTLTLSTILKNHFKLRPAPRLRWLFSLRAALCIGVPILCGHWLGDVSAGLMAAIGGFTALYGSGKPYRYRAMHLAIIAIAFAAAVTVGLCIKPFAWSVVLGVAIIAVLTTWLANAFSISPPGAYLFVLACAAGTAMPTGHIAISEATMLVLSGGLFAWLVHMFGVFFAPRAPERSAVAAAANAVADFIVSANTEREASSRHIAALALHRAWEILVLQQPMNSTADARLGVLRAINRELHLRFAAALGLNGTDATPRDALLADTRRLGEQLNQLDQSTLVASDELPLVHPGAMATINNALRVDYRTQRVLWRVGVAALTAGTIGAVFELQRAYWAVAAAVLMLHQGFDWLHMIDRSLQRLTGTWLGLVLAGLILSHYPQGLWLVLTVMTLQFIIEMLVVRNYALAVIFITCAALIIASGGHPVDAVGSYLLARGVDTLLGCAIALMVFRCIPPRPSSERIRTQLATSLQALGRVFFHLSEARVTSRESRSARHTLQRSSFALQQAYADSMAASSAERRNAEQLWPAIAATERIIYRTLAACWALEHLDPATARQAANTLFANGGESTMHQAVTALIDAIQNSAEPSLPTALPSAFADDFEALQSVLSHPSDQEASQDMRTH